VASLGVGKVIGEMGILDGGTRSARATTKELTTLLVLEQQALEQLQEKYPRTAIKLIRGLSRTVSQRLRRVTGWLADEL
jgi:CRP-like cAMP-binding protein